MLGPVLAVFAGVDVVLAVVFFDPLPQAANRIVQQAHAAAGSRAFVRGCGWLASIPSSLAADQATAANEIGGRC